MREELHDRGSMERVSRLDKARPRTSNVGAALESHCVPLFRVGSHFGYGRGSGNEWLGIEQGLGIRHRRPRGKHTKSGSCDFQSRSGLYRSVCPFSAPTLLWIAASTENTVETQCDAEKHDSSGRQSK